MMGDFQNDLSIFYLLQLILKKYQNSFAIFYAKINGKMIGYFDSKVVLEPTPYFPGNSARISTATQDI